MSDKRIFYGIVSSFFLLVFYTVVNYLAGGIEAVYWNFKNYLPYIAIIDAGFGIQVALYTHVRSFGKSCHAVASTPVTAGSMVACCLHHVTDFIPFAGVGLGLFLSRYTELFFLIGASSSVIGVAWMLSIVQKWRLYSESEMLSKLMMIDYMKMRNSLLILSAVIILIWYVSKPLGFF